MRDALWVYKLPLFPTREDFYKASFERRVSKEMDFGVYWYEGRQAWSPSWRVSAIADTGEVYAHLLREIEEGRPQVVVLGCFGPDPGFVKASAALAGWENVVGMAESLQWAVDRVRGAVVPQAPVEERVAQLEFALTLIATSYDWIPYDEHETIDVPESLLGTMGPCPTNRRVAREALARVASSASTV